MAAAFSDCVALLCLDGVTRVSWDMRLMDLVFGLILIDALAIVLVCDCVLWASALLLTVDLVWACCRPCALCLDNR